MSLRDPVFGLGEHNGFKKAFFSQDFYIIVAGMRPLGDDRVAISVATPQRGVLSEARRVGREFDELMNRLSERAMEENPFLGAFIGLAEIRAWRIRVPRRGLDVNVVVGAGEGEELFGRVVGVLEGLFRGEIKFGRALREIEGIFSGYGGPGDGELASHVKAEANSLADGKIRYMKKYLEDENVKRLAEGLGEDRKEAMKRAFEDDGVGVIGLGDINISVV